MRGREYFRLDMKEKKQPPESAEFFCKSAVFLTLERQALEAVFPVPPDLMALRR